MAKLADAADLKSAGPKGLWGFDSPSRHQQQIEEILRREKLRLDPGISEQKSEIAKFTLDIAI